MLVWECETDTVKALSIHLLLCYSWLRKLSTNARPDRKCGRILTWLSQEKRSARNAMRCSTSTMHHHLHAVHRIEVKPVTRKSSLDLFVFSSSRAQTCSAAKSTQITDLLVDWCIRDMRPLSIVSDSGLQKILGTLAPGYADSSRHTLHLW